MTPTRVAALEAVPGWAWEVDFEAAWQEKLEVLTAHLAEHGRLPPYRHPSGLGEWARNQRQGKKATDAGRRSKSGTMTPARAAALEAVPGWTWEPRVATWGERLAELEAHLRAHGQLPPYLHPSGLGMWVHSQRQGKAAMDAGKTGTVCNRMTLERAAALEAVPGWTWVESRASAARRRARRLLPPRLPRRRSARRRADRRIRLRHGCGWPPPRAFAPPRRARCARRYCGPASRCARSDFFPRYH
jgi:hypothetical protein